MIVILSAFGCEQGATRSSTKKIPRIDTPAGMTGYLQRLNLPALKSIQPWQNQYGDGLILNTKHYKIYTTLLEPLMLSQLPGFIESAYRGYQKQLPTPVETTTSFTVYLFAERDQWEDFTKTFTGHQAPMYLKIKKGAYYLKGACVVYNIGRKRTFSVIGHEGWHQFNSRHFKYRLPSWLDEGIAMQFEASRYDKGLFYFEPSQNLQRLGALKKTLISDNMIPLNKLIAMNPGEAIVKSGEETTAFYSQSYALVRFLREEDYGKRLGNFHQLLMGGLKGLWPLSSEYKETAANRNIPLTVRWNRTVGTQLFKLYIDENLQEIENEYIRFCKKSVYRIHFK